MALTIGNSPFGSHPGVANFERNGPKHVLYFEDSPRRVRAKFAGQVIADSRRARLLHETGLLPVYYLPKNDIAADLVSPTDHSTHCPFKGDAQYWSVRVGDRVAKNAMWGYPAPIDGAPPLAGYRAIVWDAMDQWFEEDEEVFVHARDPYHRTDVVPSSRHVTISLGGRVIAESKSPLLLFEASLPTRYYVRAQDVRSEFFEPSQLTSLCPYKGRATYQSARIDDKLHADIAWTYREPLHGVAPIANHVCFFNERVDIELDGEKQPRPNTRWSTG